MDFARRLALVLGSGLIFLFFSEFYFVNEGPVAAILRSIDNATILLVEIGELALFYGFFAYVFLIVMSQFRVGTIAALMLAGSVYGWATEATVIPVAHGAPPISWFWTSASWHPLIDVILGWYFLRLAMRKLSGVWLVPIFAAVGIFWAFWSTWYWGNTEPGGLAAMTFAEFRGFAMLTGSIWITGMILADWGATRQFNPGRIETTVVALLAIAWLFFGGFAFLPFSLGLVALIALTLFILFRGRNNFQSGQDILSAFGPPPHYTTYLLALIMPVCAIMPNWLILEYNLALPGDDAVLLILITGFLGYFFALWRVFIWR